MTAGKKRPGRPPKTDAERKSRNLTFRSRGDLRDRLQEAAQRSGRSLSEEIEYRLWKSIVDDDKRLLVELQKKLAAYELQRKLAADELQRKLAAGETPSLAEYALAAGPSLKGEEEIAARKLFGVDLDDVLRRVKETGEDGK